MPTRIEVNVQTGKQSIIELTQAEIDFNLANQPVQTKEQINADTFARLNIIDLKSIRPLREGDRIMLATLDAQAAAERVKIIK